mgnify:CR=1 FL=1
MASESFLISDELQRYLEAHAPMPDRVQRSLITTTGEAVGDLSMMQVGVTQGAFMEMLVALLAPSFVVEVGTFTGYSALAIARNLPPGGRLLCCDVSEEWTAIARDHWEQAGVSDRIELRLAPAVETLQSLPSEPPVDFAVIDADKPGYVEYYEELNPRLTPGGLISVVNVMWRGNVIDTEVRDENTMSLRRFNDHVTADERTVSMIITVGDGVNLIRHA